jgi:hypothetical protein
VVGEGLVQELIRRGGENALVEHLAALLQVPALAGRFITDVLGLQSPPSAFQVETQVHDPDTRARPDIVLSAPSMTVWIEAKLDAPLTPKQPGVYIDALHRLGPGRGHLVVLAKASRWGELGRLLRERVGHPPGVERTFIHQGVPVTQITWREVRDAFHAQALDDPIAAYLRSEFVATIDHHVERITVPFTSEMIAVLNDAQVLRALAALEDVLLDLREKLEADGLDTRNQDAGDLRQTGFYAWPAGDEDRMVWVGMVSRAGVIWPGRGPVWAWLLGDGFEDTARLRQAGAEVIDPGDPLPDWADCNLVPLSVGGAVAGEAVEGLRQQLRRIWDSAGP